jgi:hypothetical protein
MSNETYNKLTRLTEVETRVERSSREAFTNALLGILCTEVTEDKWEHALKLAEEISRRHEQSKR